mmetsp:Transcript_7498/g.21211  ORF Transcript_7498/g.21211 Transcript_7498/m.21211 type:complete len:252 (+) Transcript_7498:418-1173(+)
MSFSMCSGLIFFIASAICAACCSEISIPACLLSAARVAGSIDCIMFCIIFMVSGLDIISCCIFACCSVVMPAGPMPPIPPMLPAICDILCMSSGDMPPIIFAAMEAMSGATAGGVMSSISTSATGAREVEAAAEGAATAGAAGPAPAPACILRIISKSSGDILDIISMLIFIISGVSFTPAGAPAACAMAASCSSGMVLTDSIIFCIISGLEDIISCMAFNLFGLFNISAGGPGTLAPLANLADMPHISLT